MEVVLVIVVAAALIHWLRSQHAKSEANLELRYFEHEDSSDAGGLGPAESTRYHIDFQTMQGTIDAYEISIGAGVQEYDSAFHVRRVSPTKWQKKLTREVYDRQRADVISQMEETRKKHARRIAKLERALEEAKSKEDGLEDVNAIRKAMNKPNLEEELKEKQEWLVDDEQEFQVELKNLEKWNRLPDEMIGPIETQYQRYLLHGESR